MEFHQIRYFLAACDHMNFTRAAEACAVSQPALTVAIRKLEEELGGPLFYRDARGIAVTELGATMRTHLARIEETRKLAGRAAQAVLADGDGPLDLGVYSTIGPGLIAPLLEAFAAVAPGVELVLYDVWGMKAYDLLLSGAFDCAIVARHAALPDRVTSLPLFKEPMQLGVASNHPLAQRNSAGLGVLRETEYCDRLRCEFREPIHAILKREGISAKVRMRSESDSWILDAVAAGRGVTIGPRSVLSVDGVKTLPIEDARFERQIELATVTGRKLSPTAQTFVDFIAGFDWCRYRGT